MILKRCTLGLIAVMLLFGLLYNINLATKKLASPNAVMVFYEAKYDWR